MHRNNRHLPPKKKQNKVSKPYVPISSIYEQVEPSIKTSPILSIDLSPDYLSILEKMSTEEISLALKSPSIKPSEARILFERLQPHQRRAFLEELALHEHSLNTTGGYDGGGPRAVATGPSYDPDALAWFSAVEATGANFGSSPASISTNKTSFNTAFLSLKSAGIWSAIRQACFLVGPSTLAGALVNIKLTGNPVNYNFTSANYNKLTGLIGSTTGASNTTRYLDTLLNDSTDINGLDFHMLARTTMPYSITGSVNEYIFGSNNDGGETGGDINIYKDIANNHVSPNSFEGFVFTAGSSSVGFSRNGGDVTFNRTPLGWGTYPIDYAEYFSGRNFLLFKTEPSISIANQRMYRGEISFYSLGSSTDVQTFIGIVDTLKNSLVN